MQTGQDHKNAYVSEGTSQRQRLSDALLPHNLRIEDRTEKDLMRFIAAFAEAVSYGETSLEPVGVNWNQILMRHKLFALVAMSAENLKETEIEFNRWHDAILYNEQWEPKLTAVDGAIELVLANVIKLQSSVQTLRNWGEHGSKHHALITHLEKLTGCLDEVFLYMRKRQKLLPDWGGPKAVEFERKLDQSVYPVGRKAIPRALELKDFEGIVDQFHGKLKNAFHELSLAMRIVAKIGKKGFDQELESKTIPPQIGLLYTFLQLYDYPKQQLNKLAEKHLLHYYQGILRQQPKPATPDKAFLSFQLAPEVQLHRIPKSTRFVATTNSGDKIYYKTLEELVLNPISIFALRSEFVARNALVHSGSKSFITGIFSSKNLFEEDVQSHQLENLPLMGSDQFLQGESNMTPADIGFTISSPELYLEEGKRKIILELSFTETSFSHFLRLLEESDYRLNTSLDLDTKFHDIFSQAFSITYTGPEKWQQLPAYNPQLQLNSNSIIFHLHLDPNDPPLTAYDNNVHGAPGSTLSTQWPVLKVGFNQNNIIYPYSFLDRLQIESITLETEVEELRKIELYNQLGQISADKPFQPFGVIPQIGSYLAIGSAELQPKSITSLDITINWSGLPVGPGGFEDYYEGYQASPNHLDFKLAILALKDASWVKSNSEANTNLYQDGPDGGQQAVQDHTTIAISDFRKYQLKPKANLPEQLVLDQETRDGFIKLELAAPAKAFLHDSYSQTLSDVILKNAKMKDGSSPLPTPNPPFVPTAQSVTISYRSQIRIDAQPHNSITDNKHFKFFRLLSFGFQELITNSTIDRPYLLPLYGDEGNLYIGLKDVRPPQVLSLLFKFAEKAFIEGRAKERVDIKWYYLTESDWRSVPAKNILSDSTSEFTESGIVKLIIPEDIYSNSQAMDQPLYWLRVTAKTNANQISKVIGIETQAVAVEWEPEASSSDHLSQPLPEESIVSSNDHIPEIAAVSQPLQSFGGRPEESTTKFITRVSERLGHKKRAINIWDYERLVLEKFPEVFKVKCVPSSDNDKLLRVVVFPKIGVEKLGNKLKPKFSSPKLKAIKSYLKRFSSAFAGMEVRNPYFEEIRVIASVKFVQNDSPGVLVAKLDEDFRKYLSPWLDINSRREQAFGGSLLISDLLEFAENRSYVEYVTGLSAVKIRPLEEGPNTHHYQLDDVVSEESTGSKVADSLLAHKPYSVLTSAKVHNITAIDTEKPTLPERRELGNMVIGSDFIID